MSSSLLQSVSELLRLGGPVVWLLLVLSHIVIAIALLKLWQFWRMQVFSSQSKKRLERCFARFSQGGAVAAEQEVGDSSEPAAALLAHALMHLHARRLTGQALQDELTRFAQNQLGTMKSFLRPLDVIANIAPLLGLFGTVIGMIEAFQAMQQAGTQVDPAVLSGGIWVALLTTAVGLAVAMPAMLLFNWFEQITERTAAQMQDAVGRLFALQAGAPVVNKAGATLREDQVHAVSA